MPILLTKESVAKISSKFNLSTFTVLDDLDKAAYYNNELFVLEKWMHELLVEKIAKEVGANAEVCRILANTISIL